MIKILILILLLMTSGLLFINSHTTQNLGHSVYVGNQQIQEKAN